MITEIHYVSTFITLFLVSYLGYYTAKNVKSSKDFAVGGRNLNGISVAGSIMATIVGGGSTIGAAQLAFQTGVNAMWFTLGSSIACVFLGMFVAGPLRRAEVDTVSQFLALTYGEYAAIAASSITSFAIFIHITGQVLSSVAIMTSMFQVTEAVAVIITVGLIISYIFFGGFMGTSKVGIVKAFLLYFTLMISGIICYKHFNGVSGLLSSFPKNPWLNLFSDGVGTAIAQGFSVVVGIVSTQTYLLAVFAGENEKESKKGVYISALLIPPIGLVSTLIGLYMRASHPNIIPKEALPSFILTYLDPWVGGIAIATMIISVIGTGAGLTLGISTMINRDIYVKCMHPEADDKKQLFVLRTCVCVISILTIIMVFTNMNSLILKWGFLSMALRGTTIFIPLLGALYFKGKVKKKAGVVAIVVAPILSVLWGIFGIRGINALYIGLISSVILLIGGSMFLKEEEKVKVKEIY
ncbi:sodium:solute symporter family protein [Marinisporobacter balticus]|uniref:SSS family solute:Na+ symporter n=1 Tax=Marinisporobacter balticus TaxID=2018667 RepID=A0A4R2KKA6_9FIRM|nr:sodium:solute symporter family protein [Marinisporobacter balticus]TCO74421.1 SSS family solute:Na+ symporter [Marinisporobacter balticus]